MILSFQDLSQIKSESLWQNTNKDTNKVNTKNTQNTSKNVVLVILLLTLNRYLHTGQVHKQYSQYALNLTFLCAKFRFRATSVVFASKNQIRRVQISCEIHLKYFQNIDNKKRYNNQVVIHRLEPACIHWTVELIF